MYTAFVTLLIFLSNGTLVKTLDIKRDTNTSDQLLELFQFLNNKLKARNNKLIIKYDLNSISSCLHEAYSGVFIAKTSLSGQLVLWFLAKFLV